MKLRRTSLAIMTATAVTFSALSPVAGAQEDTGQVPPPVTTTEDVEDQWPGSVEGSSMLSSGEIPPAPEFGSSQFGSSEKEEEKEEEEDSGLLDDNGNIPVIGSISLPGWLAIPIGVIQAVMAVTTFAAQAAYMALSIHPQGSDILRDWLISVGINPDA